MPIHIHIEGGYIHTAIHTCSDALIHPHIETNITYRGKHRNAYTQAYIEKDIKNTHAYINIYIHTHK